VRSVRAASCALHRRVRLVLDLRFGKIASLLCELLAVEIAETFPSIDHIYVNQTISLQRRLKAGG
jgi:hypothetical protein